MPYSALKIFKVEIFIFVHLKKLVAIFLLLQITSNNAFAEELIRIPGLFTHFKHHSEKHHDVTSFLDFLHKHYSADHSIKSDAAKHEGQDNDCNLPFKHCNDCCLGTHHAFTCSMPAVDAIDSHQEQVVQHKIEDEHIFSLHVCNIWQPPKIA